MQETILRFFNDNATPFLDVLFELITMLGEEYIYIAVASYIYWNVSKKQGFLLTLMFTMSVAVNDLLKMAFHTERPFSVLSDIEGKRLSTADGFAFPSGHTQGATSFYLTCAKILKQNWFSAIAIAVVVLVGISRMYLGVHWPIDVLGGWFFGLLFPLLLYPYANKLYENKKSFFRFLRNILRIILFTTLTLVLLSQFVLDEPIFLKNTIKISSVIVGFVLGFMLEEVRYSFENEHTIGIKIFRFIIGLAGTLAIMVGLKVVFPEGLLFYFLRYFLVGFWVTFLYPFFGKKIRLFN